MHHLKHLGSEQVNKTYKTSRLWSEKWYSEFNDTAMASSGYRSSLHWCKHKALCKVSVYPYNCIVFAAVPDNIQNEIRSRSRSSGRAVGQSDLSCLFSIQSLLGWVVEDQNQDFAIELWKWALFAFSIKSSLVSGRACKSGEDEWPLPFFLPHASSPVWGMSVLCLMSYYAETKQRLDQWLSLVEHQHFR